MGFASGNPRLAALGLAALGLAALGLAALGLAPLGLAALGLTAPGSRRQDVGELVATVSLTAG